MKANSMMIENEIATVDKTSYLVMDLTVTAVTVIQNISCHAQNTIFFLEYTVIRSVTVNYVIII